MSEPCSYGKEATKAKAALTAVEFAVPVLTVIALYLSLLGGLHYKHSLAKAAASEAVGEFPNWWGTLPSAWDHPEPNYLVSEAIGEFWSVLTTIPVAGTMLMYLGLKYQYGAKVLRIYALTCGMYTLAFVAHLTLQKHIFSTTVTAVMSNAFLTFLQFSSVVHRMLKSGVVRSVIVLAAEIALISTVATLPYKITNGGVWTLFYVQSPGVFLATGLSGMLYMYAQKKEEVVTYRTVFFAGCLLSTAMVLSYFECTYGFEYGILHDYWGCPWLHIAIHIFEQVGIYYFGVGTSVLQELLFEDEVREGAELRYVTALGPPYLYCPYPRGAGVEDEPTPAPAVAQAKAGVPADHVGSAAATPQEDLAAASLSEIEASLKAAKNFLKEAERPASADGGGADSTNGSGLQRRKRTSTPGPPLARPAE